ncbi:MAG: hypothetical protein H0U59_10935 [Gemmatimonadaceae bacterium]|nr:hypothetical protein [Gemmatimonadaceae bacterium]
MTLRLGRWTLSIEVYRRLSAADLEAVERALSRLGGVLWTDEEIVADAKRG